MGLFDLFKKKPAPAEPPVKPPEQPADPAADKALARAICEELWAETARPVVRFTLEDGEPDIFASKVGGTPYLPHGEAWPLDRDSHPMDLLAQVDCSALAGLPDFPQEGLLQFFLARDDVYGADFDDGTAQTGFRVLYRETVDRSVTAEEVRSKRPPAPDDDEAYYSPVLIPARICFQPVESQGITEQDCRFDGLFAEKWNARRPDVPVQRPWDFYKRLPEDQRDYQLFTQPGWESGGHHAGGWPYFTQDDPRYDGKYEDLDVLLFQLDSDFGPESQRRDRVLWGDCGVANFFIRREDLQKRDFSRGLYNWDCC